MAKEEIIEIPGCCSGCIKWDMFGKNCWVYWDLKKQCTQHSKEMNEN